MLRQVRAQYPGIGIVVVTGNTEECVRRVEDNSLQMELDSVEALKEMAVIGLGYAALPRMAMQGHARADLEQRPLAPRLEGALAMVRPGSRGGGSPQSVFTISSLRVWVEIVNTPSEAIQGRGCRKPLGICGFCYPAIWLLTISSTPLITN